MEPENSVVQRKVCLLGDFAIGKSSLVRRFVYDIFDERYITTIGVSIFRKQLSLDQQTLLHMVIWDLASEDKYEDHRAHYFHGTAGALLVCDLTRPETIEKLKEKYIDQMLKSSPDASMIIVGNKADLVEPGSASIIQVEKLAAEYQVPFQITSAKTGENVENAFVLLARQFQFNNG